MNDQHPDQPAASLTVGALARRTGLSVSAIHFYERQGLIRSDRTGANHRRFPRAVLRVLAVIKVGQACGIPLSEIRSALAPAAGGKPLSIRQWAEISGAWRRDIDGRIARLERLRDRLGGCIGCGCLSLDMCPAINPGDRAAALGPGSPVLEGRLPEAAPPSAD